MNKKKYHAGGTFPKFNRKMVEKWQNRHTPNTPIHDAYFPCCFKAVQ